jgi:hypothetical protein
VLDRAVFTRESFVDFDEAKRFFQPLHGCTHISVKKVGHHALMLRGLRLFLLHRSDLLYVDQAVHLVLEQLEMSNDPSAATSPEKTITGHASTIGNRSVLHKQQ